MPPPSASQGDRVFALLSWAEGTGGCGLERLQEVFQAVLEGKILDNYSSSQVRHNLPRSGVAKFVGRETELETLHEKLQQSGRLNIAAIKGMGGIGKSELALQYAYRHRDLGTYPGGLCWLDLRSGDINGQIVRFARNHLDLTIPDELDSSDQLAYCWRTWPAGEVLLVYDNAGEYGELLSFLPPADLRFRVLITSRNRMGSPVETLEILVLDETASLELLGVLEGKGRVQSQIGDAKELCRRLGYLPLAIELVGRYLSKKPDLSLSVMLERLEQNGLSAKALIETDEGMREKLGVAAAFELSWQELNAWGREVAYLLSLFAPAPIPWGLVEKHRLDWDAEELEDVRDDQLCKLSLLERFGEGLYRLHPLIREYFCEKILEFAGQERMKQAHCLTMVLEAKGFPETPTRILWEGFAPVVPHLAEVAERLLEWVEGEDLWSVFTGSGRYYSGQGAYAQAKQWYERCLKECRARLGEEHQSVAASLGNLALLYDKQGLYVEAEPLYLQALEMRRKLLGEEHPDVAQSLNNLANLYSKQGRYVEAEPLLVQALEVRRKLLGKEHLLVASSLNNLAFLYYNQGRYSEAESLYKQALELIRKLSGERHPYIATSLNNLALLYYNQGRYSEAEPLYMQALELRRNLLGEEHPDVAISLLSVGGVYSRQGRYSEAELLLVQALELYRKQLGEEHPDVANFLNSLAGLYFEQGRYGEVESLHAQAISIAVRSLRSDHPTTKLIRDNHRTCLQKLIDEGSPLVNTLQTNGSEITKQVLRELLQPKP